MAGAAVVLALAGAARAQLADATYSAFVQDQAYHSPGTYVGTAGQTVVIGSNPSPFIHATLRTANCYCYGGDGRIDYQVQLSGSDPTLSVPVVAYYDLYGSASQSGSFDETVADASLNLGVGDYRFSSNHSASADTGDFAFHDSGAWSFNMVAGQLAFVTLAARVNSSGPHTNLGGGAQAEAYVDPVFRIDPTFLAAHPDYGFSFSPGVGNSFAASGAPEPATWALLIGGFGMAGAGLRRRAPLRA